MNFFSRAATTALTGLAVLGFASSAFAHHIPQQPWNDSQMEQLLDAASDVGIELYRDVNVCREVQGLQGAMYEVGALLVCTEAHEDEDGNIKEAELADTIRHELVHGIQYCLGREMIHPQYEDEFISDAQTELHWHILAYEPKDWGGEAEARILAHVLSEEEIAPMLRQACAGHAWPKDQEGN